MFSRSHRTTAKRRTPSIVGADCTFVGDVTSDGEVQIDGRLDGDIRCVSLIIGEQGAVTGEINADTVTVLGSVTGQINAQTVALAKTARIVGDISHGSLSVEIGAFVEGRFNRLPNDVPAAETPADQPRLAPPATDGDEPHAREAAGAAVALIGSQAG